MSPLHSLLACRQSTEMVATVGFLVEKFKYGNVNFTMFDMSGQVSADTHARAVGPYDIRGLQTPCGETG
jgi:hypothetical protein